MCEKVFRQCQKHAKWSIRDRDYDNVLIYEDNEVCDDDDCYKAYVNDKFVLTSPTKDLNTGKKSIQ